MQESMTQPKKEAIKANHMPQPNNATNQPRTRVTKLTVKLTI